MTDWTQLSDAYGAADDIPTLLEQAGTGPDSRAWSELWSRLCHQGGTCSASYAALPHLTDIARRHAATERAEPLILAGAILASDDWPTDVDRPNIRHADTAAELHSLTEQALSDPGVRGDSTLYVHLLQALIAFEGVEVWGRVLDGINDGEYEVPCPHCEAENFIAFGDYGIFSTIDSMYMKSNDTKRHPLRPADPAFLSELASRMHNRAVADGVPDVADKLLYVFGTAVCADCDDAFRIDKAIVDRESF